MLFQTNAPEYDKLFLNKLILGLGIRKCLSLTDRKFKVELLFDSLILNNQSDIQALYYSTLYTLLLLSVETHSQKMITCFFF